MGSLSFPSRPSRTASSNPEGRRISGLTCDLKRMFSGMPECDIKRQEGAVGSREKTQLMSSLKGLCCSHPLLMDFSSVPGKSVGQGGSHRHRRGPGHQEAGHGDPQVGERNEPGDLCRDNIHWDCVKSADNSGRVQVRSAWVKELLAMKTLPPRAPGVAHPAPRCTARSPHCLPSGGE